VTVVGYVDLAGHQYVIADLDFSHGADMYVIVQLYVLSKAENARPVGIGFQPASDAGRRPRARVDIFLSPQIERETDEPCPPPDYLGSQEPA
jgi:hypothetical protein